MLGKEKLRLKPLKYFRRLEKISEKNDWFFYAMKKTAKMVDKTYLIGARTRKVQGQNQSLFGGKGLVKKSTPANQITIGGIL